MWDDGIIVVWVLVRHSSFVEDPYKRYTSQGCPLCIRKFISCSLIFHFVTSPAQKWIIFQTFSLLVCQNLQIDCIYSDRSTFIHIVRNINKISFLYEVTYPWTYYILKLHRFSWIFLKIMHWFSLTLLCHIQCTRTKEPNVYVLSFVMDRTESFCLNWIPMPFYIVSRVKSAWGYSLHALKLLNILCCTCMWLAKKLFKTLTNPKMCLL